MKSLSCKNSNPGNIRFSPIAVKYGAVEGEKNFAKFPFPGRGMACLAVLLTGESYRELSIKQAFERYAPKEDNNDPAAYGEFVAMTIGENWLTEIRDLDPFEFLKLLEAITRFEGWKEV